MNNYIGFDISKATISIYIPKNSTTIEIANTDEGLKKLYSKLKKLYKKEICSLVFIYEARGSYSTLLEYFCSEKEIRCFKVDAAQSSSFATTVKNRSKTDARMLSDMGILAKDKDIKIPSRDKDAHKIRSFIKYYDTLTKREQD